MDLEERREGLFEETKKLSADLRFISGVVQNPPEMLFSEQKDIEQAYQLIIKDFDSLIENITSLKNKYLLYMDSIKKDDVETKTSFFVCGGCAYWNKGLTADNCLVDSESYPVEDDYCDDFVKM